MKVSNLGFEVSLSCETSGKYYFTYMLRNSVDANYNLFSNAAQENKNLFSNAIPQFVQLCRFEGHLIPEMCDL
jgi:hypothetical protein